MSDLHTLWVNDLKSICSASKEIDASRAAVSLQCAVSHQLLGKQPCNYLGFRTAKNGA